MPNSVPFDSGQCAQLPGKKCCIDILGITSDSTPLDALLITPPVCVAFRRWIFVTKALQLFTTHGQQTTQFIGATADTGRPHVKTKINFHTASSCGLNAVFLHRSNIIFPLIRASAHPMFNNAHGFSIVGAEVTRVGKTFHRINSPTEVTFTNASLSFGAALANHSGYSSGSLLNPSPSAAQHQTDRGMFTGAFNFSVAAGEVLSVDSDYERRDSATRLTMSFAQPSTHIPAAHAQRVYRPGRPRDRDYNPSVGHASQPRYNNDSDYRSRHRHPQGSNRYPTGPPTRPAPYPLPPDRISRRHSDPRYEDNAENRGSRYRTWSPVMHPRRRARGTDGRERTYRDEAEERSYDYEAQSPENPQPISRRPTY